jgi:hypothetical protein
MYITIVKKEIELSNLFPIMEVNIMFILALAMAASLPSTVDPEHYYASGDTRRIVTTIAAAPRATRPGKPFLRIIPKSDPLAEIMSRVKRDYRRELAAK